MSIKNRVIITLIISLICISNFTHAVSSSTDVPFSEVHDWMFSNGLTTMSEENFRGSTYVSRGEISKFFANYALMKGLSKVKKSTECQFKDLGGYDSTLVPTIIEACEYGLLKGSNGYYYPNNNLTEAEALAVIIRTIVGFQNENKSPRRTEYYNLASASGILEGEETLWSIGTAATRETTGRWLYNSAHIVDVETSVSAADNTSVSAVDDTPVSAADNTSVSAADDTSTLAQCLTNNGVKMYGTEWCSHCKDQKSRFGADFAKVTYINCDAQKQVCMDNGIQGYPMRKDKAGNFFPGVQSLEKLAEIGGCQVN